LHFDKEVLVLGVACPDVQDPAKTYSDPEGALAESKTKIQEG
jgi:hypothetical protein